MKEKTSKNESKIKGGDSSDNVISYKYVNKYFDIDSCKSVTELLNEQRREHSAYASCSRFANNMNSHSINIECSRFVNNNDNSYDNINADNYDNNSYSYNDNTISSNNSSSYSANSNDNTNDNIISSNNSSSYSASINVNTSADSSETQEKRKYIDANSLTGGSKIVFREYKKPYNMYPYVLNTLL